MLFLRYFEHVVKLLCETIQTNAYIIIDFSFIDNVHQRAQVGVKGPDTCWYWSNGTCYSNVLLTRKLADCLWCDRSLTSSLSSSETSAQADYACKTISLLERRHSRSFILPDMLSCYSLYLDTWTWLINQTSRRNAERVYLTGVHNIDEVKQQCISSTSEIMAWINALSMTHSTCDRFSVLFLPFLQDACVMQKNSSSIDLVLFSYDVELVAGFLTVTYRSLKLKHVVKGSCLMVRHWIHLVVFLQWSLNLIYS